MSDKEKLPWGLKQTAPGSIKTLSKDVIEAFDQGNILNKKHMSKKELEEFKKKQDDHAAAELLKDFEASFVHDKKMPKMFIKGAVINPSTKDETASSDKGNLYTPALKLLAKQQQAAAKDPSDVAAVAAIAEQERIRKKNEEKKRKSNLELFKEELKRNQLERDERLKKRERNEQESKEGRKSLQSDQILADDLDESQDSNTSNTNKPTSVDDPATTNIFISNLSPKTNEQDLIHRFGKYGLLGSVKIMWPRTDDEKARGANCGFVAFMNRRDADIALRELDGCSEHGQQMRLSWSKAVTLPSQPIYIPPELIDVIIPPPPSGLPFNAQPLEGKKLKEFKRKLKRMNKTKKRKKRRHSYHSSSSRSRGSSSSRYSDSRSRSRSRSSSYSRSSSSSSKHSSVSDAERKNSFSTQSDSKNSQLTKLLENALVKVVIPTDRNLLCLIHRVIEFVVKEGPAFEAMIMSREINNPIYRFLFDNQSPAHGYYRWKLFSILNGDSASKWRTKPFKMFNTGSYWIPPPMNKYTMGCADEAYEKAQLEFEDRKGKLTNDKREKFDEILKNLTTERKSISEAMIFCIENADKAENIVEMLSKSVDAKSDTPLNKTVAFLYLLSDILHNCIVKVSNASLYRKGFERVLPGIFVQLNQIYASIDGKMKSESFKAKILNCIRAWEDWTIYPNEFLVNLQNSFLGLAKTKSKRAERENEEDNDEDVDGKPLDENDEDDDDIRNRHDDDDDGSSSIDGKPIDDDKDNRFKPKFVSSKWEQVDPDKLEKQAITTSKWDFFDVEKDQPATTLNNLTSYDTDDDEDQENGTPMSDDEPISHSKPQQQQQQQFKLEKDDTNDNSRDNGDAKNDEDEDDDDDDDNDNDDDDDIDGEPLVENDKDESMASVSNAGTAVNAQQSTPYANSAVIDEEKRKMLRDVEVKVVKYVDEIESGKIKRESEMSIQEQAHKYRLRLIQQIEDKEKEKAKNSTKSSSHSSSSKKSRSSPSSSSRATTTTTPSRSSHTSDTHHQKSSTTTSSSSRSDTKSSTSKSSTTTSTNDLKSTTPKSEVKSISSSTSKTPPKSSSSSSSSTVTKSNTVTVNTVTESDNRMTTPKSEVKKSSSSVGSGSSESKSTPIIVKSSVKSTSSSVSRSEVDAKSTSASKSSSQSSSKRRSTSSSPEGGSSRSSSHRKNGTTSSNNSSTNNNKPSSSVSVAVSSSSSSKKNDSRSISPRQRSRTPPKSSSSSSSSHHHSSSSSNNRKRHY